MKNQDDNILKNYFAIIITHIMLRSLHSDDILRREFGFSFGEEKIFCTPKYSLTVNFI